MAYLRYPTTRALCACALTTGTGTEEHTPSACMHSCNLHPVCNSCLRTWYLRLFKQGARDAWFSLFLRRTLTGDSAGHGSGTHVDGPRALRSCKLLSFKRPALHEPDRQESPIWDRMGRQVLWWSMLECLSGEPSRQRSQRSFGGGLAWHMGRGEVLAPNIQHGAWWHLHATRR